MDDKKTTNTNNIDNSEENSDDVVIEDFTENTAPHHKEVYEKLKEKLKRCETEKQEYLDGWQRSKAEFVNARKRDEEDKKQYIKYASSSLIEQLIPVLDSFNMARANKEVWEKVDKNWRVGIEHINSQLLSVLESEGLKVIDPINQKFDPNRDEAISHEITEDKNLDNTIVEVIQKGYMLQDKIIKSPKVKVANFKNS